MSSANILNLQGAVKGSIELPEVFAEQVRIDLIRRAVHAEASRRLQPQGHYLLAGMQTTARYYGAMNSYRSGRHMGIAIRPRQKLGGGRQGQVRRIPSAVKGKRAHPHVVEKTLVEEMNRKEYQKALVSSIAGAATPLVIANDVESIRKTSDFMKVVDALKLTDEIEKSRGSRLRKGVRRHSRIRRFRRSLLIVVNEDKGVIKAARNIPGVDACTLKSIRAELFAPGGVPGRKTIWSEDAIKNLNSQITKAEL